MGEKPQIGVRYCGGCNPKYNRVNLVKRLQAALPELDFVPAEDGVAYAAAVIADGCPSHCTNVSGLAVPENRHIRLAADRDFIPAKKALAELVAASEAVSLDRDGVLALLPHRAPMLLVDTVSRLVPGCEVIASLYIDPAWELFRGHFPGDPVLPGVYAIEAIAQAADLMLLSLERHAGKAPLLASVDKAVFRSKIAPGDTLEIHASLLSERPEFGLSLCRGRIFNGGTPAAEADITLAMR